MSTLSDPLTHVHTLGMPSDMTLRVNATRVDSAQRKNLVKTARSVVYEKHSAVNCAAVENLLKEQSLVPNKVFIAPFPIMLAFHVIITECLL
jgi:uncharacterized membrane protein